jgi:hypothetical protein
MAKSEKPKPLLDAEDRKALGQRIVELWTDDNQDRSTWLKDLPRWLLAYQGRPVAKDTPWKGASNLFVPLTAWHVDAIHPRIIASGVTPTPICSMAPQEPSDADRARKTETFLDYAVREEIGLFPILDRVVLGTVINGIQFTKQAWELKTVHRRSVHEFPADMLPDQVVQAVVSGETKFLEALERVDGYAKDKAAELRKDREIVLEVTQKVDGTLCVTTEREEVTHDAPRVSLIDPEDLAVNADAPYDLQDADHVLHRYWMTIDEIKRAVRRGTFELTDKEVEELEKLTTTEKSPGDDDTHQIKETRDTITGVDGTNKGGEPYRLELIDGYLGEDINDDGEDEQIVATVIVAKPSLVPRVKRLEDVFRHGLRPFVAWYLNPVAGTFWAIGIPQVLEGIQTELNTIHNQRVDAGQINNTPFGWYVPSAGFNPEKMPLEPGFMMPVDDIAHVKLHTPGNFTAWGFQEEANLLAIAERRTKVNDLTIGRIGETQGAARTASGVQALDARQNIGFDIYIRRFQESFKLCLQQILALYAQYMPPGKETRVLGKYPDQGETVISREDLRGQYDLRFTGNALSTDRELERQVLNFMMSGPLNIQAQDWLLKLGITTPQGIAELYRNFLEAFDQRNIGRIITMPKAVPLKTPEEIVNRTIGGERVDVNPGENHEQVAQILTSILGGPDAIGLAPESIVVMQEQVQRREQQFQIDQLVQQMQAMMGPPQMGAPPPGGGPPPPGGAPPGPPSAAGPQPSMVMGG